MNAQSYVETVDALAAGASIDTIATNDLRAAAFGVEADVADRLARLHAHPDGMQALSTISRETPEARGLAALDAWRRDNAGEELTSRDHAALAMNAGAMLGIIQSELKRRAAQ